MGIENNYQADMFYETTTGFPPGKAPNGYRWSGQRIDDTDERVKRWMLVSKKSVVKLGQTTVGPGHLVETDKIHSVIIGNKQKVNLSELQQVGHQDWQDEAN